ncbi:MAG: hypothetical protein H7A46_21150 [Verrucomicrobiales bacterium]|nr:hypothetical protein [Verrucomicrobiales bacterium]
MNAKRRRPSMDAATYAEVIGAVLLIAAAGFLLIPRRFQVNEICSINTTLTAYNSAKAAAAAYYGKYGRFGGRNGEALTSYDSLEALSWDSQVLVPEELLEGPFTSRLGKAGAWIRLVDISHYTTATPVTPDGAGLYALSGSPCIDVIGDVVVEAVIQGVSEKDAEEELNRSIDGLASQLTTNGLWKVAGRVKYDDATGTVLLYIAHR